MFCFLYKWFISNTLDTGKPLPDFVKSHLGHCNQCRAFMASVNSIHVRLKSDAEKLSLPQSRDLSKRIIDALPNTFQLSRMKHQDEKNGQVFLKWYRGSHFSWKPALSMAMAVILLVVGISWLTGPGKTPVSMNENGHLISKLKVNSESIQKFAVNLESPLLKELDLLKNAANSAKDFLISKLTPNFTGSN